MTAPTHAAFGTLCYFFVAACLWWTVSPIVAAAAVLGALLPDIDIPTSAVGRPLFPIAGAINQQVGHRTLTHSLLGMGVVGLVAAPLLIFSHAELYWALLIGYLSHLLIDTENKMGIELLWPSRLRAWFFKDEKYRIQVGSKGEFVLLMVLLPLTAATFPLTYRGFTGTLHYLLGDMSSAISDFYRYMPTHDVLARVEAFDAISQERVKGEFEVPVSSTGQALGAEGNGKIFIRQGERLRELSLTGHLRPEGVQIHPGAPHRIVEQQVEMRGHLFREIAPFVEGKRVYLFGSFRLALDRDPWLRVDAFNPIRRFGDHLQLEYASFRDLQEQGLLLSPIEEGTLILKFILPPEAPVRPVGLGKTAGAIETISLKLKSLDELSARLNGQVREGEPLARSRETEIELTQIKEEMVTEKAQEEQRELLFRQEEHRLYGEISGVEKDLSRLQGKLAVYGAAGSPALFAKEIKALEEERDQKEAKARELQHALGDPGLDPGRREVAALEHHDRLRKLRARQEKLSSEVEVRANFSGQVLGMEAHHEADHVRVDLTVATENYNGQGGRDGQQEKRPGFQGPGTR